MRLAGLGLGGRVCVWGPPLCRTPCRPAAAPAHGTCESVKLILSKVDYRHYLKGGPASGGKFPSPAPFLYRGTTLLRNSTHP